MRRQKPNPNLCTRVYSYGTVPGRVAPVMGETEAHTQLKIANRLWNVLVRIWRTHTTRYQAVMQDERQDRIKELIAQLALFREEIKTLRAAQRKRKVELGDLPAKIASTKTDLGLLIAAQKAESVERHARKKVELDHLNQKSESRVRRARQAAAGMGLFWGTYNDIVQRADTGRKLANKKKKAEKAREESPQAGANTADANASDAATADRKEKAGELQFKRFAGNGTLTAQIMGGASVGKCVGAGSHSFFQTDPQVEGRKWAYARMRIGSREDRSPIWLAIPIVYHRDIPSNALIKSVSMTRRTLDKQVKWQLNVTVLVPVAVPRNERLWPAVAIDIGWRLLADEGVRVAYWIDEEGKSGQVIVPQKDMEEASKIDSLRSICDRGRDEFLPALAAWVDGWGCNLPEEWKTRTAYLAQWKSSDRLADLVHWWGDARLNGDEDIYVAAVEWRLQYLHLAHWWKNAQDQMTKRIREQYRVFAAGLVREYGVAILEEFDLREVIRRTQPEEEDPNLIEEGKRRGGRQRQVASPSEFRLALVNACRREGVEVRKVPAELTTRQCQACGSTKEWDQANELVHRCEDCGVEIDQDLRAAINLMKRGLTSGRVMSSALA